MKSAVKHYWPIAVLMAAIIAVGTIVTAFTGAVSTENSADTKRVVTTSYPLYILARTLTQDVDGVTVENLMGNSSGCMHDYQLTPSDRVLLDDADLILMGSAAAEPFMVDVLPQLDCVAVDTVHGEEVHVETDEEHDHEHTHDHAAEEHAWMMPPMYMAQCSSVAQWLSEIDPTHAALYSTRAQEYTDKIKDAHTALTAAVQALPSKTCVTFHDSVRSFAEGLGLEVVASLSVGEDAGVSAGDLAAAQSVLAQYPDALLLYDSQYDIRYASVDKLVSERQVLALDTVVAGDRIGDDWMDAMEKNARLLRGE